MERLLGGIDRNYLPATWAQLQGLMQGGGGAYGALGGEVASAVAVNSMLTPQQLALMPPGLREQYEQSRRLTALHQGLTHEALATTSARFAILQGLIDAIGGATDQKAVLDLHARIGAETTLLQNEQSKLATLSQLLRAEEHASRQRIHELSVAGLGDFATRFQPVP
jgi:type IV secretion system protein VirB5